MDELIYINNLYDRYISRWYLSTKQIMLLNYMARLLESQWSGNSTRSIVGRMASFW